MKNRIFITGASGIGKTTLANFISQEFDLPYISTSASNVWPRFGFETHEEAHQESVLNNVIGLEYQRAILKERIDKLNGKLFYVTDRSPIDNIAYTLLTMGHSLPHEAIMEFVKDTYKILDSCEGIIYLRWTHDCEIENNGKRILSPYYQKTVNSVIRMVLNEVEERFNIPVLKMGTWDLEKRKNITREWLNQ